MDELEKLKLAPKLDRPPDYLGKHARNRPNIWVPSDYDARHIHQADLLSGGRRVVRPAQIAKTKIAMTFGVHGVWNAVYESEVVNPTYVNTSMQWPMVYGVDLFPKVSAYLGIDNWYKLSHYGYSWAITLLWELLDSADNVLLAVERTSSADYDYNSSVVPATLELSANTGELTVTGGPELPEGFYRARLSATWMWSSFGMGSEGNPVRAILYADCMWVTPRWSSMSEYQKQNKAMELRGWPLL